MMRPCERCLENAWDYEFTRETEVEGSKGTVTATCKHCGHEVQFQSWKRGKNCRPQRRKRRAMKPVPVHDPLDVGEGEDASSPPWE
jgi:hypothetical protein